ncbi:hypothetical protein [Aneurinibacillus uraniidurans]|nr:hypothetical protein [Aneurinibacillus sp. B1]WCN38655.1 hypothetical protein PO771_04425 [Aneurinibacillus sp. B1]
MDVEKFIKDNEKSITMFYFVARELLLESDSTDTEKIKQLTGMIQVIESK